MDKTLRLLFGRLNPPTIGHERVLNKMRECDGDVKIVLTKTSGDFRNPLNYEDKLRFAKKAFGDDVVEDVGVYDIINVLKHYSEVKKYRTITWYVGNDREEDADRILNALEKEDNSSVDFDYVALDRSGTEFAMNMSGTKARQAAADGYFSEFAKCLPSTLAQEDKREIYTQIRNELQAISQRKFGIQRSG